MTNINPKTQEVLYIINDHPQQRLVDLEDFEDELQVDSDLVDAWGTLFDELPIEIADTISNDEDIDPRISNAAEAQCHFYHTTGLCFRNDTTYNGYILPLTYHELEKMVTTTLANQSITKP